MRLTQMPSEFQKALPVLEKIKEAGLRLILLVDLLGMLYSIVLSMMWISRHHPIQKKLSRFSLVQLISGLSTELSWF